LSIFTLLQLSDQRGEQIRKDKMIDAKILCMVLL
jgi:hypothetical protein